MGDPSVHRGLIDGQLGRAFGGVEAENFSYQDAGRILASVRIGRRHGQLGGDVAG
jgi:hypothetical protein